MTRTLAVLRPEPGNAATVARAAAAGFATLSLPLFEVRALAWALPDETAYDALILTSANAIRFGGPGLDKLKHLPVLAVGVHTAEAARTAGFGVMATGSGDARAIAALTEANGVTRALHVTGRDHTLTVGGAIASVIPVYESAALGVAPSLLRDLAGTTALLHSVRAARRLATLLDATAVDRATITLAAFSAAIAAAAGPGWAAIATASTPEDAALFDAARTLPG